MITSTRARFTGAARLAPLTGVGFTVTTSIGFLMMGKNPEPDSPIAAVTRYWAGHHAHIASAGLVLAYGSVLFALFGIALWGRMRAAAVHPLVATSAILGTAVAAVGLLASSMIYFVLGDIAAKPTLLPATVQTLSVLGTEPSYLVAGGAELLLLAVTAAGIARHVFPRWVTFSALPLGLLQLTPLGFKASLVLLLWTTAVGILLTVRPDTAPERARSTASTGSLAEAR